MRFKILGESIPIKRVDRKIIDKDDGEYFSKNRCIKIAKDLPLGAFSRTAMHEIVHAILDIGGVSGGLDSKTEEAVCTALESLAPAVLNGSLIMALLDAKDPRRK